MYISFHAEVGGAVKKNDVVMEVESDKATIEVKAPHDGTKKRAMWQATSTLRFAPRLQSHGQPKQHTIGTY